MDRPDLTAARAEAMFFGNPRTVIALCSWIETLETELVVAASVASADVTEASDENLARAVACAGCDHDGRPYASYASTETDRCDRHGSKSFSCLGQDARSVLESLRERHRSDFSQG